MKNYIKRLNLRLKVSWVLMNNYVQIFKPMLNINCSAIEKYVIIPFSTEWWQANVTCMLIIVGILFISKFLTEISKATKTKKNYWGGYDCKYNRLWGNQPNKQIRREIRKEVKGEVKDFLKLMGISTKSWDGGIEIKAINWEK